MKGITNNQLNEAAKSHALEQLGKAQFSNNKEAAKSIASDFIEGAKFVLSEIENANGELTVLVDKDFEYED